MYAHLADGTGVTERFRAPLLILPLAIATLLIWPTLSQILTVWLDDGTYSHGFLLVMVCAWLLWRRREQMALLPARTWWPALPLTALLAAAYLVALLAAVEVLQRLLVLPLYLSITAAMIGPTRTRAVLFPVSLLLLALPVWGLLIPLLQNMAVVVVSALLDWQEIPARIQGNRIRIPAGHFEIAQGCSGLRYLLVSAIFALLWGHLYLRRHRHTLFFLGVALLAALLVNWVRIYLLILIGHYTEMESALIQDHNNFGWYLFAVTLLPLVILGRSLPRKESAATDTATTRVSASDDPSPPFVMTTLLVLLLLAPLPWRAPADGSVRVFTLDPPLAEAPWQLQRPDPGSWQPAYQGLDREWHLQYTKDRRSYRLYLGWYERQHAGAELYRPVNTLIPEGWRDAGAAAPCPDNALCQRVERQGQQHVVMSWHLINRQPVTSRLAGKWQQLLAQFSGHPGAAILSLETACSGDCDRALQWMREHSSGVLDDSLHQLTGTRGAVP